MVHACCWSTLCWSYLRTVRTTHEPFGGTSTSSNRFSNLPNATERSQVLAKRRNAWSSPQIRLYSHRFDAWFHRQFDARGRRKHQDDQGTVPRVQTPSRIDRVSRECAAKRRRASASRWMSAFGAQVEVLATTSSAGRVLFKQRNAEYVRLKGVTWHAASRMTRRISRYRFKISIG